MKQNITSHATERFFDRSDQNITRKELINHITNSGEILYAKKITATRSMAYIPIKNEKFKVIINRKTKKLITILPYQDIYKHSIIFHSKFFNNKTYMVELYPDCYIETNSMYALTKIYELKDNDQSEQLLFNHPFYNGLFDSAWKIHQGMKGLIHAKNEIKNKAIEITTKSTVQYCC